MVMSIKVDTTDVEKGIDAMRAKARRMGEVMRALKGPFRKDLVAHQKAQSGPDGAWPKRSRATQERFEKRNKKFRTSFTRRKSKRGAGAKVVTRQAIQEPLGVLPRAVKASARSTQVLVQSVVPYASAHNDGATVGRGVRIPRRELFFASDDMLSLTVRSIEEHVISGWDGKRVVVRSALGRVRLGR